MTRGGKNARRGVDRLEAAGRLRKARAFHRVAQDAFALLEREALDHAPVLSNASLAAIAYTDAVTISADGSVNRKDHSTQANRTSNSIDTRVAPLARIEPDRLYRLADKTPSGRPPWNSSPHAGTHWKTRELGMLLCMTSMNC